MSAKLRQTMTLSFETLLRAATALEDKIKATQEVLSKNPTGVANPWIKNDLQRDKEAVKKIQEALGNGIDEWRE